jgi:hypothetical protein
MVYVDGEPIHATPLAHHALDPGVRRVRLVNDEAGIDDSFDVTIRAGQSTRVFRCYDR